MYEEFREWVLTIIGTHYRATMGRWVEDSNSEGDFFCVFQYSGQAPIVDTRYPSIRLLLIGPRNDAGAAVQLGNDAQALMAQAVSNERGVPCEFANIRATGEPVGPGYTVENRAWFSLDFELII